MHRSKEAGGLALPNPWLYFLASQLQHIAQVVRQWQDLELNLLDSSAQLLSFTTGKGVADGLEALCFNKSNKLYICPYAEDLEQG